MSASSDITNLYLYGTSSTPSDKADDALIRPSTVTSPAYEVNINDFMNTGGGRFALGAQFDFIQDFFLESISLFTSNPNFQYGQAMSKEFVAETIFGLGEYDWEMAQVNFSDGSDYAERVYIYNTMSFKIAEGAQFIIESDGRRRIEYFAVVPRDGSTGEMVVNEDFNFEGGDWSNVLIGLTEFEDVVDPSKIGRAVDIDFTGTRTTITYDGADFNADLVAKNAFSGPASISLNSGIVDLAKDLWNSGVTKFLDAQNRPIIYGTTGSDNLDSDINGSLWADLNGVPTIDDAIYASNGIVLLGGAGDDRLLGGLGNDQLVGGADEDTMVFSGAWGQDVVSEGEHIEIGGNVLSGVATDDDKDGTYTLNGYSIREEGGLTITKGANTITLTDWVEDSTNYGLEKQVANDNNPMRYMAQVA